MKKNWGSKKLANWWGISLWWRIVGSNPRKCWVAVATMDAFWEPLKCVKMRLRPGLDQPRTPLKELTALPNRAVFKGEGLVGWNPSKKMLLICCHGISFNESRKCVKMRLRRGSTPDPAGGAHSAPQTCPNGRCPVCPCSVSKCFRAKKSVYRPGIDLCVFVRRSSCVCAYGRITQRAKIGEVGATCNGGKVDSWWMDGLACGQGL